MINALSHRDYYDRGGKIIVELFDDRVEIPNPGGLVSAIKPKEFGYKSHSRNPLIFGLFNRMDMVEQAGFGIGRILLDLEKTGQPKPIYKTDGLFTVVFQRQKETVILKNSQKSTEYILDEKYGISMRYLHDKYGISAEGFGTIAERLHLIFIS